MKWLYVLLALLYTLFPYDLLPDFLTGLGWVDDLIVLGLVLRFLYMQLGKSQRVNSGGPAGFKKKPMGGGESAEDREKDSADRFDSSDPYTVLGIERSASDEQLKKAYRDLVGQYHPDKVAHLGEEFKRLAEERFKQIQQAYQKIQQARR